MPNAVPLIFLKIDFEERMNMLTQDITEAYLEIAVDGFRSKIFVHSYFWI